ncbi:endonuclease MutS2 [Candidatus Allofournierella excrementavium]|uniref:endonuclease MutS2 n=1 Tax=Candidatus Allofournierella excrementavium TaxID=2838591 RepID=UPI003AF6F744
MDTSYRKTLELDKILERAAALAVCPEARTLLLEQPAGETPDEVRYALSQTDAIASLLLKNGSPRFGGVSGVDKVVSRAVKGGVLSMAELLEVAGALRNFQNLVSWYGLTEHDMLPVDDLFYALSPQPGLEKQISSAILSPEEMADTASNTLFEVRRKIQATENSIRDKLDAIIKNSTTNKFLQDAVVSIRNGRFVVPVRAEYRGEVGGVIHDVSSSGATVFVEPTAVVEANAKIMQLRSQEKAEIERILIAFTEQVASIEPMFNFSYKAMLDIDVLLAKAHLALEQKAWMPQVADDVHFDLKKARHPLIDPDKVVPIDVALGENYDTLVITGPNTGGKTVTLKTAGLLCAMAQHGLLIPAHEHSTVCVFTDYLVDIGDEQSIEQSLSTFSGHMKKITGILDNAFKGSLVLLDELGAGTDPAEGAALAVSIIEQLRIQGALVMATTHYSELKVFALETAGVVNASCEFDVESLRPTYKLSVGVPGKSNAFLISEKLGLPARVIQRAQTHLASDDKRLDDVLAQLDDLKLQLKESQDEAEKAKAKAEKMLEKAREKCDALVRQGETELEAARLKARQMTQQVQAEAYALTDELHKLQKDDKQSAAQRAARAREIARKDAERLFAKSDVAHNPVRQFVPLKEVRVGQEVVIAEYDQLATVTSLPDRNGMVEVRAGIIRTKVPLSGLKAPDKLQKPQKKGGRAAPAPRSATVQRVERSASMEINLLGMTVEEALMETDQFIDHAVMNGQTMVYLIHGKGTGALRNAIHQHLRGHKNVKSFRLGRYGEGEAGVTVVELK